jgi:peptidoglycan/xylan/chitin deacetylase (PgdA/CDA1 family)
VSTLTPRIASFGYHEVTDDPILSGFQRAAALPFKHTRRAFATHLAGIAAGPFAPGLVVHIDFTRVGRHVLLTFDDGGKSAVYVADELARRGWRGHFFIVTSLIGTRTFVDAADIKYLRSCGHVVGSHSHTHPDIFRDQTPDRMLEEWRTSSGILADLLGEPCIVGSVPGGDISSAVLQSAAPAGLRYLFTSEPWTAPRQVHGSWILGRFGPKAGTSPLRVAELARFRGWRRALFERRLKGVPRRSLPALYRLYVRRTTQDWATP